MKSLKQPDNASQEPEVLDAATLAAVDKGIKSLDEGKGMTTIQARQLTRKLYQAWLQITQNQNA